jgi:RNA polymerase sigma-70 factor (ECF subfamily)
MGACALRAVFAECWKGAAAKAPAEETLAALVRTAREAWPELATTPEDLVRYVAARLPARADPEQDLVRLHAGDLLLACACASGDRAAIGGLNERYLSKVERFLEGMRLPKALVDEVRAALSERLLVEGTLSAYEGRGPLEGWVRIAAIRTALNLQRSEKRWRDTARRAAAESPLTLDPELEIVRGRHRSDFESALQEAMASIPARDRNLLRLRFVDRLGTSQIGAIYGVHRVTVSRWLQAAHEVVLAETQRRLRERMELSATECDSLIALLRSRIEVTLHTLLGTTKG